MNEKLQKNYTSVINNSGLAWLKLDVDFAHKAMHQEILQVENKFYDHTKTKGETDIDYAEGTQGWKSLGLHAISSTKTSQYYRYGYDDEDEVPYKWTNVSEKFPITVSEIKKILPAKKYYRIKINKLEPGGIIAPHNDSKTSGLGISDATSPSHITYVTIPIYWPKKVYFYLPLGSRIPIKNGEPLLLDYSCFHEVISESHENRYFIVVCADFTDISPWMKLVLRSYKKYRHLSPKRPITTIADKIKTAFVKRLSGINRRIK